MGAFENAYTEKFTFEEEPATEVEKSYSTDDATTIQRESPPHRRGARGPEED